MTIFGTFLVTKYVKQPGLLETSPVAPIPVESLLYNSGSSEPRRGELREGMSLDYICELALSCSIFRHSLMIFANIWNKHDDGYIGCKNPNTKN